MKSAVCVTYFARHLAVLFMVFSAHAAFAIDNFGTVVSGAIYRGSNAADEQDMAQAKQRYSLKSILNLEQGFNIINGWSLRQERAWCGQNGVEFLNTRMSNIFKPSADTVRAAVDEIVAAPKPVFVHCMKGKDRTGLVIAAYRILHQGWSLERAYQEMLKYGHKPGGFLGDWKTVLVEIANER